MWVFFFFIIFTCLLYFLASAYMWYHTIFVFFWLISLSIILWVHQCCRRWQNCILFYSWLVSIMCIHICGGGIYIYIYHTHTYTYIPHLYPFICQQMTLRLIPYLGNFVNNAAMNIGCMNLFKVVFLFLSDTYPGVELLSHIVVVFIILRKKLCSWKVISK